MASLPFRRSALICMHLSATPCVAGRTGSGTRRSWGEEYGEGLGGRLGPAPPAVVLEQKKQPACFVLMLLALCGIRPANSAR